jgi:hypothetical protein
VDSIPFGREFTLRKKKNDTCSTKQSHNIVLASDYEELRPFLWNLNKYCSIYNAITKIVDQMHVGKNSGYNYQEGPRVMRPYLVKGAATAGGRRIVDGGAVGRERERGTLSFLRRRGP